MSSEDEGKPASRGNSSERVTSANGAAKASVQPTAAPLQAGLDWQPDGSVALVERPPAAPRYSRPKNQIRGDAKRTAEYLASRGATPAETIHDVVKLGMVRAIRLIVRETGCTRMEALAVWERLSLALLPYTAARFETIELGPNAAGGLALGHFLAARTMSDALAAERDSPRDSARSRVGITLDGKADPELPFHDNDIAQSQSGDTGSIRGGLPPKGAD